MVQHGAVPHHNPPDKLKVLQRCTVDSRYNGSQNLLRYSEEVTNTNFRGEKYLKIL
jgi:hypothetical protein